jgi:hypothetical protein
MAGRFGSLQQATMGKSGRSKSDVAFDRWLSRALSESFDPVLNEPVPPDLLALLEEDERPDSGGDQGGDGGPDAPARGAVPPDRRAGRKRL